MSILFYDHLVNKNNAINAIDELDTNDGQKSRLKKLVDDIVHQGLLEFILQKLHPHQHDAFLRLVTHAPYDPVILEFLRKHAGEDIEVEIEARGRKLVDEILEDLKHQKK